MIRSTVVVRRSGAKQRRFSCAHWIIGTGCLDDGDCIATERSPFGHFLGSSPPARGTACASRADTGSPAISAPRAGSRTRRSAGGTASTDHTRVRGEQVTAANVTTAEAGSPSACAGSRGRAAESAAPPRDHPRLRGEQLPLPQLPVARVGSPLRARGADDSVADHLGGERITLACAGSRDPRHRPAGHQGDHPRVRGEQAPIHPMGKRGTGSPPRARGAAREARRPARRAGITPRARGAGSA